MLYKYSHSIALSEQRSLQLAGCHCESTGESRNAKTIGPMPLGSAHLGFWAATLKLGGGWFEYFVCSFLLVAMIQFDEYFHQMGGWNHQLVCCACFSFSEFQANMSVNIRRDPRNPLSLTYVELELGAPRLAGEKVTSWQQPSWAKGFVSRIAVEYQKAVSKMEEMDVLKRKLLIYIDLQHPVGEAVI